METDNLNSPPIVDQTKESSETTKENKGKTILGIVIGIVVLGLIVFAIISLFRAEPATTSRIRDIFIIFMAFGALLLTAAVVILVIQVAILINILKNEIKPIIETTNETVNNLRGTTAFLSNNLVEPVLKMNEYLAGLKKFFDLVKPSQKKK